ncbi:MAG: EAL domain-containing protein [Evtepia gabavorous]
MAFSNDVSSSLGVLRADVNQLAELNQRRGKEAGDRMVCHVAQVLRRRFGPGNVYRINGDEFVVFRTDVTYRKFAGDVEACQQLLEEQAPGRWPSAGPGPTKTFRSRGWSTTRERPSSWKKQRHGKGKGAWGQQAFWGLEEAFAKGHFHIYLQPKAEIASGRIRGAEALIRYRDDQHGVVGPDKFIPQLERSGLIRHIDLFVLEEVCRTLRRWREQGVEPIPISLNLSRYTLMEKGILARINGITSRYQVDRRLLKLEITESIGDVERRILEEISREIVGTATASPWTTLGPSTATCPFSPACS